MSNQKSYIVYDARARFQNPFDCAVFSVEPTLEEARSIIEEMEWDACIYEYDDINDELVNGRLVEEE